VANPAAGNGWGTAESTQALPVRGKANGNGAPATGAPANGTVGDDADEPVPGDPGSQGAGAASWPSRLPSFGGPSQPPGIPQSPIGSQNVRGGDGPSARGPGANGAPGTDGPDSKADAGQVTVPAPATHDQRLPIFDSLESDWFRRSGKTLSAARTPGPGQPAPVGQTAAQSTWTSPADEGWRAAQALTAPSAGDTTQAGLPKRVPRANLVPGSVGGGGDTEIDVPARSPDAARTRMASFQRGVREGRAAGPQTEEP